MLRRMIYEFIKWKLNYSNAIFKEIIELDVNNSLDNRNESTKVFARSESLKCGLV